MHFFVLLEIYL